MDSPSDLVTKLNSIWQRAGSGPLEFVEGDVPRPSTESISAPVAREGTRHGWLICHSPDVATQTEGMLIELADLLAQIMAAGQLSHNLSQQLITAWNRLDFLHQIAGLMRSTPGAWTRAQKAMELGLSIINARSGFVAQHTGDELTVILLGDQLTHTLIESLVPVLDEQAGVLVCNTPAACDDKLNGQGLVESLIGQRLTMSTAAPTYIGLLNKEEGFNTGDIQMFDSLGEEITTIFDIEELLEERLRAERVRHDLEMAAEIQTSFLPDSLPSILGYDIAASLVSATEIGGDFYDTVVCESGNTGFLICDVAGKGMSAALLAATLRIRLRDALTTSQGPSTALKRANHTMYDELNRVERFATAFLLSVPSDTGPLTYASAGHTTAYWVRAEQATITPLPSTDLPLGILETIQPGSVPIEMADGDVLVMYTDGLTEARNPAGDIIDSQLILDVLRATYPAPADVIMQSLLAVNRSYRERLPPSDDLTLIILKRVNENGAADRDYKVLYFDGKTNTAQYLQQMLAEAFESAMLAPSSRWLHELHLAVVEIVHNIRKHALTNPDEIVHGLITVDAERILIDLYDRGVAFASPSPGVRVELAEGGYGLKIVEQVMDTIAYTRLPDGQNHWHLVRSLPMP